MLELKVPVSRCDLTLRLRADGPWAAFRLATRVSRSLAALTVSEFSLIAKCVAKGQNERLRCPQKNISESRHVQIFRR